MRWCTCSGTPRPVRAVREARQGGPRGRARNISVRRAREPPCPGSPRRNSAELVGVGAYRRPGREEHAVSEGLRHGSAGTGGATLPRPAAPRGLPPALRPLRHREFRLLAASAAASLTADGLWLVASVWQVMTMGGGPADLSVV